MAPPIRAVAFDCYGTLIDYGDEAFARAYTDICRAQGFDIDGKLFYDKWMEVWRRLAAQGKTTDSGTVAVGDVAANLNSPAALSETEPAPPHPRHHDISAGRSRNLGGPPPLFRPYRDEWPEHFAICFEELGLAGDAQLAYEQLRDSIGSAPAFPETRRVVETVSRRISTGLLSNADDDFLLPCLARNGLVFPVVLSSEGCQAYKPHYSVFETLGRELGLPHESILYVGDSRFADVAGAKHAGLQVAWVNRPGVKPIESTGAAALEAERRELPTPDYEIDSLDGILAVLEAQGGR